MYAKSPHNTRRGRCRGRLWPGLAGGLGLLLLATSLGLAHEIQPRATSKTGFPAPSGSALTAAEYDSALFGLAALMTSRAGTQTLTAGSQINCRNEAIVPVVGSGGPVTLSSNPQILTPDRSPHDQIVSHRGHQ